MLGQQAAMLQLYNWNSYARDSVSTWDEQGDILFMKSLRWQISLCEQV